ncbi:putative 2-aminoethylphosphonate ABC transporter ATP-binding protein [Vogesella sp. LIG4]|uniref:putative 2-aminoethylphosphonate ABC transporter ATP-binding protein n=1 Tax=Vogesella sp. LIG4 TaxID=1192162 RepID=UPI00081FF198|nr:putative 2-aminoethylphosphonate ABC transporter ATP-binding protein [Vogesella sp. LIG4]SCK28373.1 iron(III) transport system ATP-binding protein [Vogesella sp. LIG4]
MKLDPQLLLQRPLPAGGSPQGAPYLQLSAIGKRFGSQTVLHGLDLNVDKGEFVCLLGPSGCGKTTLLRQIAGLDMPDSGSIRLLGRDITRLPPAARDYGIVFQSYALFPNLSVADNIAYGLNGRREDKRRRVAELLTLIGLDSIAAKYPSQLSGGQQQRVALARALATSPGLLLLDEPLSALDARVREHLRREIRALQQKLGITTIMVTHDQEEALTMADRVVVMNAGRIEQSGSPFEVYREPASRFVASFVGQGNWLPVSVSGSGSVQLGEQYLALPQAHGLPAGSGAELFVRPEDIVLHPQWPASSDAVLAEIRKLELLGAVYRISLHVPAWGAANVVADLGHAQLTQLDITPQQRVPVSLNPARLRLFPRQEASA